MLPALLSGTAIKAIVAYISDYVTKPGLKTYIIFDTIRSVFAKSSEMLGRYTEKEDKGQEFFNKNLSTAYCQVKEIGDPMASLSF